MKKILSLVLALALVLTAVSAMAATGSKEEPTPTGSVSTPTPAPATPTPAPTDAPTDAPTNNPTEAPTATPTPTPNNNNNNNNTQDETPEITIKFITDTPASAAALQTFKDALTAGDVLSPLPEDIRAKVPEGFTNINEMLTAQFEGNVGAVKTDMILNVTFETKYPENSKVMVLIGILPTEEDGEIEWNVFEGKGLADGSVEVVVPKEIFEKVQNNPFLIGVISE